VIAEGKQLPVHGFVVIAPDGKLVGRVAGESERTLVVESGRLRKRWRPLPKRFAGVSAAERCVHMQISRREFLAAPRLGAEVPLDETRVSEYYGPGSG
jgi:hypothetical protein